MMRAVTSRIAMLRFALPFAVLALGLLAVPATAGDVNVSFQCCSYSPGVVRILPGQTVTWQGANGATFAQHPLRFPDATVGDQTDASGSTDRTFAAGGIYLWYCGVHGHYDAASNTVSGMSGKVIATTNTPPTASFTASAADVPSGTEVRFDGTGSSDPDFDSGQTINYAWDLDGDGQDDPGQTGPQPSMIYTNTGTTPRQVTVRLTATDTNSDAVGPESSTKSMVITVEPQPVSTTGGDVTGGSTGAGGTGLPVPDTRAPVARIVRAKIEHTRVRVTFSTNESSSVTATLRQGHRKSAVTRDFAKAGRHTITLRVTRKLRHRKVALTLAISDDAGNGTTLRRTLKLR
jgi:plastocyanin